MKISAVFFFNILILSSLVLSMEQHHPILLCTKDKLPLNISTDEIKACEALSILPRSGSTIQVSADIFAVFTKLRDYLNYSSDDLANRLKEFDITSLNRMHRHANVLRAHGVKRLIFKQFCDAFSLLECQRDFLAKKTNLIDRTKEVIKYADWISIPLDMTMLGICEQKFTAQLSKSGNYLLIHTPKKLCIWDLYQFTISNCVEAPNISSAFFNNAETCFGVIINNQVQIFLTNQDKCIGCLNHPTTTTNGVFNSDDSFIATWGPHSLSVWDVRTKKVIFESKMSIPIKQLFFVSSDTLVTVLSKKIITLKLKAPEKTTKQELLNTAETVCIIDCFPIINVCYASNKELFAIAHVNGSLSMWDLKNKNCLWQKKAAKSKETESKEWAKHLAFNPKETLIAVAYNTGRIALLNCQTCRSMAGISCLQEPITCMQFDSDDNLYFSADGVRRLNPKNNRCKILIDDFEEILGNFNQAATMVVSRFLNQLYINLNYTKTIGHELASQPFIIGYCALVNYLEFDHIELTQEYYDILPVFVKNLIKTNYTIINPKK